MATTRTLTGIKFAATVLGAFAVLAAAPATAFATDNEPTPGGGCTYTDADGYPVPIDDGQDVFVDGKIVSCRGGKIVITTAPARNTVRPPLFDRAPVLVQTGPVADSGPVLDRGPVLSRGPVLATP